MIIEKTKLFHKLNFGTRWNLRDSVRHKARTAMSLVGVIGCAVIIIAGLGMRNTMDAFLDEYFNESTLYASRVYLEDNVSLSKVEELTSLYGTDTSQSIAVKLDDKAVNLDLYDLQTGLIRFPSEGKGFVELTDDGALLSRRLADEFNLQAGDTVTVSPYGTDEKYTISVKAISRSLTESIIITRSYAEQLGISYTPGSIYSAMDKGDIAVQDGIKTVQSKQMIMDSFDSFMEIMNMMIAMLILAGALLGIIVLYNLGTMSYAEHYREMATLKVLGFKDQRIGRLLIGQNLWVTMLGLIIGLPLGVGVLSYLLKMLASEYELFMVVKPLSYAITAIITLGVSLLVSWMVARKNRKIDMVQALKAE